MNPTIEITENAKHALRMLALEYSYRKNIKDSVEFAMDYLDTEDDIDSFYDLLDQFKNGLVVDVEILDIVDEEVITIKKSVKYEHK